MRLRHKIFLLAVVPLVLSIALIAQAVRQQQRALAQREHALVEEATMAARRAELRHYVELALRTLDTLPRGDDEASQRAAALQRLAALEYGDDGYFFLYDLHGRSLMHPRQPELVGNSLWELRDAVGQPTIQRLIAQARAGGGFVTYPWRKPSTDRMTPKLAYVVVVPRWGWMLGTGIYLDDVEATLAHLDRQAAAHIDATLWWLAGIALFGVASITACGLALNLSEHRVADAKLRRMALQAVQALENERAYLSRELHDGTSQTLVSAKLLVETAHERLSSGGDAQAPLAKAGVRLAEVLDEVRRLSHRLRPALLDVLGLPSALEHLGREAADAGNLAFSLRVRGAAAPLPENVNTVLFRVAQEALANIEKHAQAESVRMRLVFGRRGLRLSILDDGRGFDLKAVQADPRRGIGLRNMRERLASVGGRLRLSSHAGGTSVVADLPAAALKADAGLPLIEEEGAKA
ncbi:cache domain-containing protein [Aquincola sp. MAHUQ-54]|uniref:histidine kinase n=1 Tax=Aquincola agrisoli TaxID=3119538 RepID=A0AAW9QIV2_9BURK